MFRKIKRNFKLIYGAFSYGKFHGLNKELKDCKNDFLNLCSKERLDSKDTKKVIKLSNMITRCAIGCIKHMEKYRKIEKELGIRYDMIIPEHVKREIVNN